MEKKKNDIVSNDAGHRGFTSQYRYEIYIQEDLFEENVDKTAQQLRKSVDFGRQRRPAKGRKGSLRLSLQPFAWPQISAT